MADGGRALGVLSAAIESAEQVAIEGEDEQGGRLVANAVTAVSSTVDPAGDDSTGKKAEEEDTGTGDDKENGGEANSAETAAPVSDENTSNMQSIASLESPYTVWHGEEYASRPQRSRLNNRNGSTGSRGDGGRGGSRSVGSTNINSAGAPFVPLLCWQAARISLLRADMHRSKLNEARLFSRPVPMGSVNSLKSAWLAAKGYLEKGLQCPFPTATAAFSSSSSGHCSSGGPDHHIQVLLAWHLAALAAQGPLPGIGNSNSNSSEGASVDFEVDGRRSASHFAFAKSALLAAAAAAAVSSHRASARIPGSSTSSSSLSAAPAMSGGAAAAVRAARSNNHHTSSESSSRWLAQSQASPLTLLTTPERCFQLVFALARADSQAGRRCAAASAMRASLRRGCSHLWARHVLLTLALQRAVDKKSSNDASSSFGADGAVAGVYDDDDADALAAAEAAAKVGDGGALHSALSLILRGFLFLLYFTSEHFRPFPMFRK